VTSDQRPAEQLARATARRPERDTASLDQPDAYRAPRSQGTGADQNGKA
jgi:hypothetical protein